MKEFKPLTKAEEQIMQILWEIKNGFTNDIIELMPIPKPHYNTVSTMLKILVDKGFVSVKNVGKSNNYTPIVSKEEYSKKTMSQFIKGYFDGSFSNMLSYFAKEKEISIKDLEEILKEIKK